MTDRFTEFLKSLEGDTYPEPESPIHSEITAKVLPEVVKRVSTGGNRENREAVRVLDVGCGQGVALRLFRELGCEVLGITTNGVDFDACRSARLPVSYLDMHDVATDEGWPADLVPGFDLIWARHVLEHSPAPLFALLEFWRVLKPGGWLYIEVPMPGTACGHCFNRNHYSVLTDDGWQGLIAKAQFELVDGKVYRFTTSAGPDEYRSYLCRKSTGGNGENGGVR